MGCPQPHNCEEVRPTRSFVVCSGMQLSAGFIDNRVLYRENKAADEQVCAMGTAMEATKGAHAVAILTEWDEFKTLDWKAVLGQMQRPAFVFDGRNILDHDNLRELGFIVYALGKPLDPFILGN